MEVSMKVKSPKMKQVTLSKFFSSPTNNTNKLKDYKIDPGSWLSKRESNIPNRKETQSFSKKKNNKSTGKNCKDNKSWKKLQEAFSTDKQFTSNDSNSDSNKKSKDRLLLAKSESFETYGMVLPSVDKIIDNINNIKRDAKALDDYEQLCVEDDDSITETIKNLDNKNTSPYQISTDSILDCKHLSIKQLKMYFRSNLDYVRGIKNEVEYSLRHEIYKDHVKKSKLTYNTSTVVFSDDQIDFLLRKLEKKLDPESNNTEYMMMVLLPEICLRIFMAVYEMNVEEAVNYLDWRPVD